MMNPVRPCPLCSVNHAKVIERFEYTDGTHQVLNECVECGMVYASESPSVDYRNRSKYAMNGASGSGETEQERKRLDEMVSIINGFVPDPTASILDIGCARGGLLQAFKRAGFTRARGIDPSPVCVEACRVKGLRADVNNLLGAIEGNQDAIVLSHVMEHVWDVVGVMSLVEKLLVPGGIVYIETPNVLRYSSYVPFMETNREHVNHFSIQHLMDLVSGTGLCIEAASRRDFVRFQTAVPSIYVVGKKMGDTSRNAVRKYLDHSLERMEEINVHLERELANEEKIVMWGYGEFAQTLLRTKALKKANIVQVVDRDSAKHGEKFRDIAVEPPEAISFAYPILVASIVNRESIESDIRGMGLENKIIRVGE